MTKVYKNSVLNNLFIFFISTTLVFVAGWNLSFLKSYKPWPHPSRFSGYSHWTFLVVALLIPIIWPYLIIGCLPTWTCNILHWLSGEIPYHIQSVCTTTWNLFHISSIVYSSHSLILFSATQHDSETPRWRPVCWNRKSTRITGALLLSILRSFWSYFPTAGCNVHRPRHFVWSAEHERSSRTPGFHVVWRIMVCVLQQRDCIGIRPFCWGNLLTWWSGKLFQFVPPCPTFWSYIHGPRSLTLN
jgi:hypothetical protein